MPQSPKQRRSPEQDLFRKETWQVSLHPRAAPAAGHGGTGHAPFPPAAHSAWWAGGGSGCKEQQRKWMTHICAYQVGLDTVAIRQQSLQCKVRCCGSVGQMSSKWHIHVRSAPQVIASLWSLKTTNGVQSPDLLCASNGGWQEKPGLSTATERKKKTPFLTYINPGHKMTFSFANLQKYFYEINLKERIRVIYAGVALMIMLTCVPKILHSSSHC